MRVLICGGGVIGASIAYFLSRCGVQAMVIERTGLACAASGKVGGFLALDWCDGTPLQALARRSFALHAQLVEEIGGDCGYRRLTTYSGASPGYGRDHAYELDWLAEDVTINQRLGSTETTAQVHPGQFTAALMRAAQAGGGHGCVTGIVRRQGGAVGGVEVEGEFVEGDAVVIAMGPWSLLAAEWLPLPAVYGLKGHSLVFETGTRISADAVFLDYWAPSGAIHTPELFPRADGTTYVCAISSETPLPIDPAASSPTRVRSSGWNRCAGTCRRCSPRQRSCRGRLASARSRGTACR
jgi:glycine/D-amino acid oxidase-like deaminating enzyme